MKKKEMCKNKGNLTFLKTTFPSFFFQNGQIVEHLLLETDPDLDIWGEGGHVTNIYTKFLMKHSKC